MNELDMGICKYCGEIYEGKKLSGHTGHCKSNPNRTIKDFVAMNIAGKSARETPYSKLRKEYPEHTKAFKRMHNRVLEFNHECDYPRNLKGFSEFIEDIGPYPTDMIVPSVGRRDHAKGYVKDNFDWQSRSDNSREAVTRYRESLKV